MLSHLNQDQQAVLALIAVESWSYSQAAEVLDILPAGTLMSRLARGRKELRKLAPDDTRRPVRPLSIAMKRQTQ